MNTRLTTSLFGIALASLWLAMNSALAAVRYNENVSGDAGVDPGSVALGILPTGNQQIIGGNPQFDTDDYAFTIGSTLISSSGNRA